MNVRAASKSFSGWFDAGCCCWSLLLQAQKNISEKNPISIFFIVAKLRLSNETVGRHEDI
jgi:hypothetical protein